MQVKEIYNWLDAYAPFAGQERWDNSGLWWVVWSRKCMGYC